MEHTKINMKTLYKRSCLQRNIFFVNNQRRVIWASNDLDSGLYCRSNLESVTKIVPVAFWVVFLFNCFFLLVTFINPGLFDYTKSTFPCYFRSVFVPLFFEFLMHKD